MDKNKLEISGKTSPDTISASYKPIPEKDMEEEALSRPKSLHKVKDSTETDGADEKMLPGDEKVPEVVVFNNDTKSPQNGDAKLDIAEAKQAFVGLTKEELMKYANDPFWVRLRWFLFICFWLLWATMLVGAILIIYAAPKCDPPPPRTWYQQGPLTQLPPNTKLEDVKLDINIQGVIVPWNADAFEPLENNPEGLALIKDAQMKETRVIVELEPAVSSVWFEKSEKKDPEFEGYYIWRNGKSTDNSKPNPPTNWVSPSNTSSWKFSETRQEYYYSPLAKPHLNFRNRTVVEEFSKVIERFLALNVSGIRLRNARFLLVDSKFEDESPNLSGSPGSGLTEYGFFLHSRTEHLPELAGLLKEWRTIVKNRTDLGPFMISDEMEPRVIESYKFNQTLVLDMPLESHVFSKPTIAVNETVRSLNYILNTSAIEWPLWEAKTSALSRDVLNTVLYLLPGAPLVNISEPVDTVLLKIRDSPSIMRGICGVYGLQNNTVLTFIRVTPGSPGILVAVNPTEDRAVANLPSEIPPLSNLQEVTVRHFSSNYNETDFQDIGGKRDATAIPISPRSAIVLEYVPKKDE